MKFSHALEGFWLSKRLDFSAATVQNYERVFRQFLAHLGNREIEAITSDDIRRYLDYLHKRRKLSKRSVHSQWAILSSLWTWAEGELRIPHVIRGKVPAPSYRKRAIVPFTQDEIKRLLDAAGYNKSWLLTNEQLATLKLDGAFAYSIKLSPLHTSLAVVAVGEPRQANATGNTVITRIDLATLSSDSAASGAAWPAETVELPAIIVSPAWSTDEQSFAFLMSSQTRLTLEVLTWSEAASRTVAELPSGEWVLWLLASPFNYVSWSP